MLGFVPLLKQICNQEQIEEYLFKQIMQSIETDLTSFNYSELSAEYCNYFSNLNMPLKNIKKDEIFYRGRAGNVNISGAIDECNKIFTVPYSQSEISAVPPLLASGGRFNRDGISYLYLASNIETCLAETHIAVG